MNFDGHTNFAVSTVLTAPSPATTGTTLTLASGTGALFPAAPFQVVVTPTGVIATAANSEILRVTAKNTDVLTVQRHVESSATRSIIVGDTVSLAVTAKALTDMEAAINSILADTSVATRVTTLETAARCYAGTGSPEGIVPAAVGSIYTDLAAGAQYTKYSGSSSTGWI
jgi:tRNA threonylcarbamoyladenosine modification (KEOPS) complex  Pcc1 subunit